jgi:hypothetical protein
VADSHILPAMIRKTHSGEVDLPSDQCARRVLADTEGTSNCSVPDDDVHRLVSDVEQLIGIHAGALLPESNPVGHCGCRRARRPVRGSVHRITLVSPETYW